MNETVNLTGSKSLRTSSPFLYRTARSRSVNSRLKRLFDLATAMLALILLVPAFLVIGVLIKLDSKGPVFFRQQRTGLMGKTFHILKFRTMTVQEAGESAIQAQKNDVRVTRVGKVLRKTSLDELPQLINIFNGEMSLVGPRPHALVHDEKFAQVAVDYHRRFAAKPGLTGLAQVSGLRGLVDTPDAIRARTKADIEYIETWSVFKDIMLILRTIPLIFGDRKAF